MTTTSISLFPVRRAAYAVLAVALLVATVLEAAGHGAWWPAIAGLVGPDVALLFGGGRGPRRGQLHPRAVGLYNALHRFHGPAVLLVAGAFAGHGLFVAGLA